jgi:hypothetical protein
MKLNGVDIEELQRELKSVDWRSVFYDPLHDFIEAESEVDKVALRKVEQIIDDLKKVHQSGNEGATLVQQLTNYYWKGKPMEDQIENLFPKVKNVKMFPEHVISDEIFDKALSEFARGPRWIAYNTVSYFLEKGDVYFFRKEDEAREFSRFNISDYDNYNVIYASSVIDLLKQIPYGEPMDHRLNNSDSTFKNNFMNEQNFEYLKDNLKYMGFGEKQNDALEQQLKSGKESFQLTYTAEVNKKPLTAILQFRKSDNSDMYFFNSYHASLERKNGEKVEQTFYLTKGKGVTAKEAYNLLEGRAVHKELSNKAGEPYKAWIQLDFTKKDKNNNNEVKQYHENYGYDLKAAVGKYKVQELDGGEKEKTLMQSLQKGNIQSVTIEKDGKSHKMFIEANPQFKTVAVYDAQLKRLQKEDLSQYQTVSQSQLKNGGNEKKEEVKQDSKKAMKEKAGDDLDGSKKKNSRKKGLSV